MDLTYYIERLRIVPCFVNMNIKKVRRYVLKDITEKVYNDDSHILQVPQQNLVSFVYYLLQQLPESEAKNDKVLLSHPNNINANCMKIILSAKAQNFAKAEEHLKRLEELRDVHHLVVEAEAEIAFAFSKVGVEYHMVAITKFTNVVEERSDQYEWKYRLAFLLRKCQDPKMRILLPTKLDPSENIVRCKSMFEDIISKCSNDTLKALSLVQIALLYMKPNSLNVNFIKLGIDLRNTHKIVKEYLDRALSLDQTNVQMLCETGRILRKINELESSRKVLEDALRFTKKRETYHNLALTIKDLEGTTSLVIKYLKKASGNGINQIATIHLGDAYMHLEPPKFQRALQCLKRMKIYGQEYNMMQQKYDNLSKCYEIMMHRALSDIDLTVELRQKMVEMNQKSIVFGILCWIKSTPKNELVMLKSTELFPDRWMEGYDLRNPKDSFLNQLHYFQGKYKYPYLQRLQYLVENGSLDDIEDDIMSDFNNGKYEDCLEMTLFLLITDIYGIDQFFFSTMIKILKVAVETRDESLANKSFLWPMEYLYMVNDAVGHFRILTDHHSLKEAKMIETWLENLSMIVVRNDEDISPFADRQEALIESFKGNVAVLCIIKGNNSTLSNDYPINMLPADEPHLLLIVADASTLPKELSHHHTLKLPPKDNDQTKAAWLTDLAEIIFRCE
ncbi:hypothetical protein LOTGIDRAFT_156730 [Lottia gigantea]|uniref:Uncharacterized protein n=1 Tax=Lottia gigantea TaxID=225164 RepID=V4CKK4_LOTGI|nr:hypothetical protein LOTGIDRAFT_156730 [Lottia gigantea]ESP02785.1 hypothetical protein LOTGIDRAFT_156730 [Lottia gigantea]